MFRAHEKFTYSWISHPSYVLFMFLVDLVNRLLILLIVPTKNYFVYIALTPAIDTLFVETSAFIPTPVAFFNRCKKVTS